QDRTDISTQAFMELVTEEEVAIIGSARAEFLRVCDFIFVEHGRQRGSKHQTVGWNLRGSGSALSQDVSFLAPPEQHMILGIGAHSFEDALQKSRIVVVLNSLERHVICIFSTEKLIHGTRERFQVRLHDADRDSKDVAA